MPSRVLFLFVCHGSPLTVSDRRDEDSAALVRRKETCGLSLLVRFNVGGDRLCLIGLQPLVDQLIVIDGLFEKRPQQPP